ncbi:MAG: DinB family protein [Chloroflexi bacterium]|nr:DinB family protein [Chloroflexota bacterium]
MIDPARWARDRQYLRADPGEALDAFRGLRGDLLAFLDRLRDEQWSRGSIHPTFGRLSYEDWAAVLAWHDDNHVEQIESALAGSQ